MWSKGSDRKSTFILTARGTPQSTYRGRAEIEVYLPSARAYTATLFWNFFEGWRLTRWLKRKVVLVLFFWKKWQLKSKMSYSDVVLIRQQLTCISKTISATSLHELLKWINAYSCRIPLEWCICGKENSTVLGRQRSRWRLAVREWRKINHDIFFF